MNLRDLSYLCAVAETCHFGQAAERCHVSQPTLSAQIRKLEEELGVVLFERTNKSVRITPVGSEILAVARRMQEGAEDIRRLADGHRDPFAGILSIGIIPTIAPMLIPDLLSLTRSEFPNLRPSFVEDMTDPLLSLLREGGLDVAILATEPDPSLFSEIPLYDEPFWVAFPIGHAFTHAESLTATDIDPSELLLLSEGHCFRDQALAVCHRALAGEWGTARGFPDMRATSMETILNLVAAGAGITLIPSLATRGGRLTETGVVARPFDRPESGGKRDDGASRRVRLVFRRTSPRRRLMQALGRTIVAALPTLVRPVEPDPLSAAEQ